MSIGGDWFSPHISHHYLILSPALAMSKLFVFHSRSSLSDSPGLI